MKPTSKPYLILVGIDYSKASELALERGLQLSSTIENSEVHVVHVASDTAAHSPDDALSEFTTDTPFHEVETYRQLQTYVSISVAAFEEKRKAQAGKPLRVISHLRIHNPALEIAQLASDLEADLVVVGMHGRNGVYRFFLGSVAESVTRLSPCPVLVFRPKGLAPEFPRIEPPCPKCVEIRVSSGGEEYWCEQHRERHGQRHSYYQTDLMSQETNLPLVMHTS
jgi:nucleotide-binding universal stress UspA family protein